MNWIAPIVIYGGGLTVIALAVRTIVIAWRGNRAPAHPETPADHWRRVHIDADRRAPYSDLRLHGDRPRSNFKLRRRA